MACPVSVIIPCYRCAGTIERAVRSVAGQTLPPTEILLVEDCSNDDGKTLTVLHQLRERYAGTLSIKVIPLPENRGPGGARNAGWEQASQPLIAFLDADDSWHPKKLEIQYGWMEAHPEVALTGHSSALIEANAAMPDVPAPAHARRLSARSLLLSNRLPTRSVMLRRTVRQRFEPNKRYAEDYLLWLRIVLGGQAAWRLELPLAYSYKAEFGAAGLTGNLWKMEKGELETFEILRRERLVSGVLYLALVPWSWMKFARRLVLSQLQRIGQRRAP